MDTFRVTDSAKCPPLGFSSEILRAVLLICLIVSSDLRSVSSYDYGVPRCMPSSLYRPYLGNIFPNRAFVIQPITI